MTYDDQEDGDDLDDDEDDWDDDDDEDEDDWDDDEDDEDDWDDWDDEDDDQDHKQVIGSGSRLDQDIERLSHFFPLWLDDWCRFVVVERVRLPPGYNLRDTSLLIELPSDYPASPPGIGNNRVFVSPNLTFYGRKLRDVHPEHRPRLTDPFGGWAWFCYQSIRWHPLVDDLITFVEMVRTDLTNPPTQ